MQHMLRCIRTLGAPGNELKAIVIAPPTITTNQTIPGIVVSAAKSRSCASRSHVRDCKSSVCKFVAGRPQADREPLQLIEISVTSAHHMAFCLSRPLDGNNRPRITVHAVE